MIYPLRFVLRLMGFTLLVTLCLPAAVSVTITSNPIGRVFTVDGAGCGARGFAAPQALSWNPGANCTFTFVSPHSTQIGTQYVFAAWQDGPTANPRVIVTPGQPATYTANFTTQFFLTAGADPPAGGTVSGGGWYSLGSTASLNATPSSGYHLVDWTLQRLRNRVPFLPAS